MKQVKKSGFFKRGCAFLLCLSFVLVSIVTSPLTAQAVPIPGKSNHAETIAYINKCYNSTKEPMPNVKRIGFAYLVGTDDIAAASWTTKRKSHEIYAVELGTKIQGKTFNAKYYPQDNIEYLKDISKNYGSFASSGKINWMSNGAQYEELEGAKFQVVACDKDWVTIWDGGYQSWNPAYAKQGIATGGGCEHTSDIFLQTHPAGFYRVQRNKVWLDLAEVAYDTHPYNSKDKIPNKGTGVVTRLAKLRPYPNEDEKTDWKSTPVYALPKNVKVTVVSTELVPSKTEGSTNTYYKVAFSGTTELQNNTVGYLAYKIPGVYYINSKCLNFTEKGKALPKGNTLGEITNVSSGKYIYAYESKDTDSAQLAYLQNGVQLEMYPSESDADWTTVYFSGQKCYVQTKYIKKGKYKVKDIGAPYLYDIVNNELIIKWNKGEGNVDFSCTIKNGNGKVIWSKKHVKKNKLTVTRELLQKAHCNGSTKIILTVQATDKNGDKGKKHYYIFLFGHDHVMNVTSGIPRYVVANRTSLSALRRKVNGKMRYYAAFGHSVQISTNKKFKKARTVEKTYKEKGETKYKIVYDIKKLKPNTTYYIRTRYTKSIKTSKGDKQIMGPWGTAKKLKTKK